MPRKPADWPADSPRAHSHAQIDREVGITYDADPSDEPIEPGDILQTARGVLRLIVGARKVRSKYPTRWALRCIKVDKADPLARVLSFAWYPREPRRRPV